MRILLIEDDRLIATALDHLLLLRSGFLSETQSDEAVSSASSSLGSKSNLEVVSNGDDAVDMAKRYDYDVIITELSLPDDDGFGIIRRIRHAKVKTPIMVLSGVCEDPELQAELLHAGVDDIVLKPFNRKLLLAKIHAVARRAYGHSDSSIVVGDLTINISQRTAYINDVEVHLTGKEFYMLELLASRLGTLITKEMFLTHLYNGMDEVEIKIIDVFICKLRKKLKGASGGNNYIETVWGRGYKLCKPATDSVDVSDDEQQPAVATA